MGDKIAEKYYDRHIHKTLSISCRWAKRNVNDTVELQMQKSWNEYCKRLRVNFRNTHRLSEKRILTHIPFAYFKNECFVGWWKQQAVLQTAAPASLKCVGRNGEKNMTSFRWAQTFLWKTDSLNSRYCSYRIIAARTRPPAAGYLYVTGVQITWPSTYQQITGRGDTIRPVQK